MTDSLFPSFTPHWIETSIGKIFARKGGKGNPLLLIHGFPQTHVEWHKMAGELAKTHTVIAPDLLGYGWSSVPSNPDTYTKSTQAKVMIEVMESFGFVHFDIIGHDRGARVAYRLELENKGRAKSLCLIDIIPTFAMWEKINEQITPANEHWVLLSQPKPIPENQIKKNPTEYLESKLSLWTEKKDLSAYHPLALQAYRDFFNDPSRIHACCNDYRAGATKDLEADWHDLKNDNKITCKTLVLWGESGIPSSNSNPLDSWQKLCSNLQGQAIKGGHFLPEENPQAVLEALKNHL